MNQNEMAVRWLAAFGAQCSREFLAAHVYAYSNYLWHIFSFEQAACLDGDAAEAAFDAMDYESAYIFRSGKSNGEGFVLDGLAECGRLHAADFEARDDFYVVDPDFKWTFVHTHEHPALGPYFCKLN